MSERTHVQHAQRELVSDGSRLLDLAGLAVDRIESDAFGGRVVHVITADDETASACPTCGVFCVSLKGQACTRPRDIPYGTRGLRLIWHKSRRPIGSSTALTSSRTCSTLLRVPLTKTVKSSA